MDFSIECYKNKFPLLNAAKRKLTPQEKTNRGCLRDSVSAKLAVFYSETIITNVPPLLNNKTYQTCSGKLSFNKDHRNI